MHADMYVPTSRANRRIIEWEIENTLQGNTSCWWRAKTSRAGYLGRSIPDGRTRDLADTVVCADVRQAVSSGHQWGFGFGLVEGEDRSSRNGSHDSYAQSGFSHRIGWARHSHYSSSPSAKCTGQSRSIPFEFQSCAGLYLSCHGGTCWRGSSNPDEG